MCFDSHPRPKWKFEHFRHFSILPKLSLLSFTAQIYDFTSVKHVVDNLYRRFGHLSTIFPKHFKPKPHLQYSIFSQFLRSNWVSYVTHQNTYFDQMNFWFSIFLLSITWFNANSIWFLLETHNHISLNLTPESTYSHINKFTVEFSKKVHK